MKKVEVGNQLDLAAELGEVKARLAAAELRIEKLDPSPKLETIEPYKLGTYVYSVQDLDGSYPLTVIGFDYDRGIRRILVLMSPDDQNPRSLPLDSVRPIEQCPRAEANPGQAFAHMDPKSRAFFEGRRKSQIEAATTPFVAPVAKQVRYGPTREFGGGNWK